MENNPLHIGAKVTTDFSGKVTTHTITEIVRGVQSQSGICLRVSPAIPKSSGESALIDLAWFDVCK